MQKSRDGWLNEPRGGRKRSPHKSIGAIPSIPLGKDAVQNPRVLNGDSLRRQKNLRAAKVYAPAVPIREVRVRESTGFIASVLVGVPARAGST